MKGQTGALLFFLKGSIWILLFLFLRSAVMPSYHEVALSGVGSGACGVADGVLFR